MLTTAHVMADCLFSPTPLILVATTLPWDGTHSAAATGAPSFLSFFAFICAVVQPRLTASLSAFVSVHTWLELFCVWWYQYPPPKCSVLTSTGTFSRAISDPSSAIT